MDYQGDAVVRPSPYEMFIRSGAPFKFMFSQCLLYAQLVVHGLQLGYTTCETCIRSGAPARRRSLQYLLPEPHMGGLRASFCLTVSKACSSPMVPLPGTAGVRLTPGGMCVASTHDVWQSVRA